MILLIDNYDSFVYNLYQYAGFINPDIKVFRNDELSIHDIEKQNPSHIILSPGPGRPEDAGITESVITRFKDEIPILGVCLGHQAICEVFGGVITFSKTPMHGKKCLVEIDNKCSLFLGLPSKIEGARYHSLCAEKDSLPDELEIIAKDETGEVMGVKHNDFNVFGVQFHPESILTPCGKKIIENFLKI